MNIITPADLAAKLEFKGDENDSPSLEYKDVGVNGITVVDEEQGIVEAIVSVTGLKDNVNDNIKPGAYAETLKKRVPKGVWGHDWNTPVSRTIEAKELMPGDPELPANLPSGAVWPQGAGAVKVKAQFNLKTQRGKDAFEDVKFFGAAQEWSIGYRVPKGCATMDTKSNTRNISKLDFFEYSPVLFGAMSAARTVSVKDAQVSYQRMNLSDDEFKNWLDKMDIEIKEGNVEETAEPTPKPASNVVETEVEGSQPNLAATELSDAKPLVVTTTVAGKSDEETEVVSDQDSTNVHVEISDTTKVELDAATALALTKAFYSIQDLLVKTGLIEEGVVEEIAPAPMPSDEAISTIPEPLWNELQPKINDFNKLVESGATDLDASAEEIVKIVDGAWSSADEATRAALYTLIEDIDSHLPDNDTDDDAEMSVEDVVKAFVPDDIEEKTLRLQISSDYLKNLEQELD